MTRLSLYNEKFANPAQQFMKELKADGVLKPNAPFEHNVQWVFWELWHHEGRRARHGASMMGPDYTHWHGMYEVSKHYYLKFLPEVVKAAATKGSAANVGYEAQLWQMADALRGSMDAAEYKHVVLGLIFLKYISDAFEEQHAKLVAEKVHSALRGQAPGRDA